MFAIPTHFWLFLDSLVSSTICIWYSIFFCRNFFLYHLSTDFRFGNPPSGSSSIHLSRFIYLFHKTIEKVLCNATSGLRFSFSNRKSWIFFVKLSSWLAMSFLERRWARTRKHSTCGLKVSWLNRKWGHTGSASLPVQKWNFQNRNAVSKKFLILVVRDVDSRFESDILETNLASQSVSLWNYENLI